MDETFDDNMNYITAGLQPMQAIAASLEPLQSVAASLVPCEQVIESARAIQDTITSTVDISCVADAANALSSSLEPIMETVSTVADIVEPVNSTFEIISETTEIVRRTIDLSGITAAIMRTVDLFSGIGEILNESLSAIHDRMHEVIHNFWHWLVANFKNFFEKRKEKRQQNLLLEIKQVIILCPIPYIKSLIINFHERTQLIRKTYLLRNQDRGSDDSSDNYDFYQVTLLTA